MKKIEFTKYKALLEEFKTSDILIRRGLGEMQDINLGNDFFFLPFQLLSQGFERFMKAYICIGHYNKHHFFPKHTYLKSLGHDLEKSLDCILDNHFFDYGRSQFSIDKKFISNDVDLKQFLYILSEFGKQSRYYNFDVITDNLKYNIDTKALWENVELKILDKDDIQKLSDPNSYHEVFHKISNFIIIIFEKFISALSRQLLFKCLGEQALNLSSAIAYKFGTLYDGDYGKKDYREKPID